MQQIPGAVMELSIARLSEIDDGINVTRHAIAELEEKLAVHNAELEVLLSEREELARFVDGPEGEEADGCDL